MKVLGSLYAVSGLFFFFAPDLVVRGMNLWPLAQPTPESPERFWLVLAVAMMAMLSAVSFLAAGEPRNQGYPLVHLLSKVTSVLGFTYMFFMFQPHVGYLVGIGTDLPLAILVAWVWSRRDRKAA